MINNADLHLATYVGDRHLEFHPRQDITAFELAKCMEIFIGGIFLPSSMESDWSEHILVTNPGLERHFKDIIREHKTIQEDEA